jgi:hypothetical protein
MSKRKTVNNELLNVHASLLTICKTDENYCIQYVPGLSLQEGKKKYF